MSNAVAELGWVTGIAYDYVVLTIPQLTERVMKGVMQKGLIPQRLHWKVELEEDYSRVHVNAYSPGVYILHGKRGCPSCGGELLVADNGYFAALLCSECSQQHPKQFNSRAEAWKFIHV